MERLRANISEADLLQMINDVRKANRAIQEIHDPRFICTYEQAER